MEPPVAFLPLENRVALPLSEGEIGVRIDSSADDVRRELPKETGRREEDLEERVPNDPGMDIDVVEKFESLGRGPSTPLMSHEQAKLSVAVGPPDYPVGEIAKVSAGDDISGDESDLKEVLATMTRDIREQIVEHEQQIIATGSPGRIGIPISPREVQSGTCH